MAAASDAEALHPSISTPLAKQVSFGPVLVSPAAPSSSTSALPIPETTPTSRSRRRSSMKEGAPKPFLPPKETYQHPDPLIRRLRLKNREGKDADLKAEFRDAQVVLFLFGAWSNGYREPYEIVDRFASRHPHQCKVVYCSVDHSERGYKATIDGKAWLSMEWSDGSNAPDVAALTSSLPSSPPQEPFLLATDPDLESEMHLSDPHGALYLRPYSRVFLAEKFRVLSIPSVVVYHLGKREVLSEHARIDVMKPDKGDETWAKWEKGERVELTLADVLDKLKWTLGIGVVAAAYVVAVRLGGVEDVIGKYTEQLGRSFITGGK